MQIHARQYANKYSYSFHPVDLKILFKNTVICYPFTQAVDNQILLYYRVSKLYDCVVHNIKIITVIFILFFIGIIGSF